MPYTVSQLSKISGVSHRTLRWYDNVGLLKPLYRGSNGRRYYEEAELLRLQQILFFRELGFGLQDIQKLLDARSFEVKAALSVHRRLLEKRIDHARVLIENIDRTLKHIKGTTKMSNKEELYLGLNKSQRMDPNAYIVNFKGTVVEEIVLAASRNQTLTEEDHHHLKTVGDAIYRSLTDSLKAGLMPDDKKVHVETKKHYELANHYANASKKMYLALAQVYCEHELFIDYFVGFHPNLAPFLAEAMCVFAAKNLT